MKKIFLFLIIILHASPWLWAGELEKRFWSDYQTLLDRILIPGRYEFLDQTFIHSGVNYQLMYENKNEALFAKQLARLSNFDPEYLKEDSLNTVLAFWINVYNFITLAEIKKHYPISSMKKIGWDNKSVTLKNTILTLDEVEHKIIRPLGEPRIHFAINCASVSCPTLHEKIYEGDLLEEQLDFAVRNAMKNPLNLRVEKSFFRSEGMYVSKIFSWFDDDFGTDEDILAFIHSHAPDSYKKYKRYKYISYNWDINTKENIQQSLNKLFLKLY